MEHLVNKDHLSGRKSEDNLSRQKDDFTLDDNMNNVRKNRSDVIKCKCDKKCSADQRYKSLSADQVESDTFKLHWDRKRERRGLGELIYKANHITLTVSDVGKSLAFYRDVLGLQQIRRPNLEKHGAWLTMGNLELHLVEGKPVVPSGNDLIVSHISLETYDIDKASKLLQYMRSIIIQVV